jgi:hypothetical protein
VTAAVLPTFITKGLKTARPRASLKTARKRASKSAERFSGDTGTKEMKQRQQIVLEARQRSLRGEPTVVGARVEAQLPHDRYRVRNLLDPQTPWKNERFWDAAERLRRDFHESAYPPGCVLAFSRGCPAATARLRRTKRSRR